MYKSLPVFGYDRFWLDQYYDGSPLTLSTPRLAQVGTDVRVGTAVGDYRFRIAHRLNASSAYRRDFDSRAEQGADAPPFISGLFSSGRWEYRYYGWIGSNIYQGGLNSKLSAGIIRDIALKKIRSKIDSDRGDYAALTNLPQDIYEFQRTVGGTLDACYDLVMKAQRRLGMVNFRRGFNRRALLQDFADLWLGFSFGINPTISDAKELAVSIQKYLDRKDHLKHFGASHYDECFYGNLSSSNTGAGCTQIIHDRNARRLSVKFLDARLVSSTSGLNYASINEQFHLAPTDFIPMMYELLPWSWLLDYVVNVGEVIEDTFQSRSDNSLYVIENTKDVYLMSRTIDLVPNTGFTRKEYTGPVTSEYKLEYFTRTPASTLPQRILRFRTKYEIKNNLLNKTLNILSILISRSRSHHFR